MATRSKKRLSNFEGEKQIVVQDKSILETQGDEAKFVCLVCNQFYKSEARLRKHELRHKSPGGFICTECDEGFSTDAERLLHKEAAHKIFKCLICSKKFKSEVEYSDHIDKLHDGQDREYSTCDKCGAQFRHKKQLLFHCASQCGTVRCFTCVECDSKFMTQFTLNTHMLIHTGEKKFLCNYCGNSFLSKGQLKIHERSHTKEKPYKCKVCGKAFPYRESLVTHMSVHTGIKPFQCECCSKRFSCIGNLIKHRRTRPQTCGLPIYTNIKCAPRASTKELDTKAALKKSQTETSDNDQSSANSAVLVSASASEAEPVVNATKPAHSHADSGATKQNVCLTLKVDPDFQTMENEFVYVTTNENYVVSQLTALSAKNDGIILPTEAFPATEQIIVLETPDIDIQDVQYYPIKKDGDENFSSSHEQIQETMHQYQIISADEIIGSSSEIEQTFIVETFECEYCMAQFISNDLLIHHLRTSHGVKSISTEVVVSSDETIREKQSNIGPALSTKKKPRRRKNASHACTKCGRTYNSRATLNDHQQSNCGQSPIYQCSYADCGKSLHSLGSLKTHELIHTGTLAFTCRFCEKRFRTQGQVKVHERRHNGDKPFKCAQCSKTFAYRESLITHMSLHTGLKRFVCQGCDKRFSCISNLQAHRRTHQDTCGQLPLDTKAQHAYVLDKDNAVVSVS